MKIILANPRGFCAGVNMAIECVEEALEIVGSPIYVYHEIVHNRYVVENFVKSGVIFVDSIDEVPANQTVIFSAHGVSPAVRQRAKERGCTMIDATCPLVTKVHMEAIRYARQGYKILLIGHAGHDEVVGTFGEAPDVITIVELLIVIFVAPVLVAMPQYGSVDLTLKFVGLVLLCFLPLLAQLKPGDALRFERIALADAQRLAHAQAAALKQMGVSVAANLKA